MTVVYVRAQVRHRPLKPTASRVTVCSGIPSKLTASGRRQAVRLAWSDRYSEMEAFRRSATRTRMKHDPEYRAVVGAIVAAAKTKLELLNDQMLYGTSFEEKLPNGTSRRIDPSTVSVTATTVPHIIGVSPLERLRESIRIQDEENS